MKLDVEYKEDKITSLGKEMVELEARGAAEDEVARLKKQKQDLESRLRDQEEEMDDLAGQVQQKIITIKMIYSLIIFIVTNPSIRYNSWRLAR